MQIKMKKKKIRLPRTVLIKASDITAVNVSGDVVRYKRDNEKPLDFDDDRDSLNYQ